MVYPTNINHCSCQKSFAGKLILLILVTGKVYIFCAMYGVRRLQKPKHNCILEIKNVEHIKC